MYNPEPLYAQNANHAQENTITPTKYHYWKGFAPTAASPSQLYLWWHHEDKKRSEKLLNEHCINEIKAAHKDKVKNKWTALVESCPEKIDNFLTKPIQQRYDEILRMPINAKPLLQT